MTRALLVIALMASVVCSAQEPSESQSIDVVQAGCNLLVTLQEPTVEEGEPEQWPYEGVYRVREGRSRVIPIGYRVGGTAIVARALVEAPGYMESKARRDAVERGVGFILRSLEHPLMQPSLEDRYDVRGWGHIYALLLFLRMAELDVVPEAQQDEVAKATAWFIDALQSTAIPKVGGWNYAGRKRPSPFMTAPALQALFLAAKRGHDIDERIVHEALDALERGRAKSGSVAYAVPGSSRAETEEDQLRFMDKLPGSMGRMASVEVTLWAAGRGNADRLEAAVDAFFEHWEQLEVRRRQNGTHIKPYGVAPYYFMYAHEAIAMAIELQDDEQDRAADRDRLRATLMKVAEPEGGWNDRVFPRSRNYGTATAVLALIAGQLPRPTRWGAK